MVIFPESDHLVAILALLPSAAYSSSLGFRFLNGKMGLIIRPPQNNHLKGCQDSYTGYNLKVQRSVPGRWQRNWPVS